jgi:hypothetical protein
MNNVPSSVVMVRPSHFAFNAQTAANNAFQNKLENFSPSQIQDIALLEFDNMVSLLRKNGIEVILFDDKDTNTPDSIFPNNWFSTFTNEVLLYPMFSENRRNERKADIYKELSTRLGKAINSNLVSLEDENEIVEGTGSLVCDYSSKTAFAAMSPRTTHLAMNEFEKESGYSSVRFDALGPDGNLIYHTNVMMTMADTYVVIGLETVDHDHRTFVKEELERLGKEVINLSNDQVYNHFAGNMLQLSNSANEKFLVMSKEAHDSLTKEQITTITEKHNNSIIACPIHIIEKIGGGSARCMMAEIFYQ